MEDRQKDVDSAETAGAICEQNILVVEKGTTVGMIREILNKSNRAFEPLDYIYVEDNRGVLVGIVSLRQLFVQKSDESIDSFMNDEVVSVSLDTDQEHVALLALQHELKSVPVLDGDKIYGVVPAHKILSILNDEHVEDLLKEAGVVQEGLSSNTSSLQQVKGRIPWLLYGTVGGLLAAGVVQYFEGALAERLLLAAFIPTIVYLADAVGNQVQTLYVRAYAFGLSQQLSKTIVRELGISLVIGLIISIALSLTAYLWFQDPLLGMILLGATMASIVFASIVAVIMPWLFIRLGRDPAVSSGPLGTIILDVSSIIIYFLVAEFVLSRIGI